jgi:hypothetical protein
MEIEALIQLIPDALAIAVLIWRMMRQDAIVNVLIAYALLDEHDVDTSRLSHVLRDLTGEDIEKLVSDHHPPPNTPNQN